MKFVDSVFDKKKKKDEEFSFNSTLKQVYSAEYINNLNAENISHISLITINKKLKYYKTKCNKYYYKNKEDVINILKDINTILTELSSIEFQLKNKIKNKDILKNLIEVKEFIYDKKLEYDTKLNLYKELPQEYKNNIDNLFLNLQNYFNNKYTNIYTNTYLKVVNDLSYISVITLDNYCDNNNIIHPQINIIIEYYNNNYMVSIKNIFNIETYNSGLLTNHIYEDILSLFNDYISNYTLEDYTDYLEEFKSLLLNSNHKDKIINIKILKNKITIEYNCDCMILYKLIREYMQIYNIFILYKFENNNKITFILIPNNTI